MTEHHHRQIDQNTYHLVPSRCLSVDHGPGSFIRPATEFRIEMPRVVWSEWSKLRCERLFQLHCPSAYIQARFCHASPSRSCRLAFARPGEQLPWQLDLLRFASPSPPSLTANRTEIPAIRSPA